MVELGGFRVCGEIDSGQPAWICVCIPLKLTIGYETTHTIHFQGVLTWSLVVRSVVLTLLETRCIGNRNGPVGHSPMQLSADEGL
jgi:hypothetical protein